MSGRFGEDVNRGLRSGVRQHQRWLQGHPRTGPTEFESTARRTRDDGVFEQGWNETPTSEFVPCGRTRLRSTRNRATAFRVAAVRRREINSVARPDSGGRQTTALRCAFSIHKNDMVAKRLARSFPRIARPIRAGDCPQFHSALVNTRCHQFAITASSISGRTRCSSAGDTSP